jgi:signal recognition particle subunit SRP54
MVHSMTPAEREDIDLLNKSRMKRIARGSGTSANEVGQFVKQFEAMRTMTKQMAGLGMGGRMKAMREMGRMDPAALAGMGGMPGFGGRGSTQTPSIKSRFKQRRKGR